MHINREIINSNKTFDCSYLNMSNKNIFTGPEIVYIPTSQRKDAPKQK